MLMPANGMEYRVGTARGAEDVDPALKICLHEQQGIHHQQRGSHEPEFAGSAPPPSECQLVPTVGGVPLNAAGLLIGDVHPSDSVDQKVGTGVGQQSRVCFFEQDAIDQTKGWSIGA